jgi:PAS domain S-box-containing protein
VVELCADLYRQIVEAAPSAIVMTDGEGRIVLVNAEAERLFGWTRTELVGQAIEKLVPSRWRPQHPRHRATFQRTPKQRTIGAGRDLFALRRDGTEVPVEIGLAPLPTDDGLFVLATVVDLTERHHGEQRFRVAVESSPNAIAMVDENGVILLVNQELERLFGYSRSELLGRVIDLLVPERLRGRHPEYRHAFARDPRPRAMGAGRNLFGVRKDGTEVPVEIGLAPILSDGDLRVLASVVDITERRRAEDRFRQAVESAPNAIVMVDAQGGIMLANSRAGEIFGYRQSELIGQPVELLVPTRFRGAHPGLRGSFYRDLRSRPMGAGRDLFGLRKDGTEFPVEIGLNPLETRDGTLVLASVIDITDRKRTEEMRNLAGMQLERTNQELLHAKRQLEHAVAELERRNQELDEFAYAVSHDLRSPLRAIDNLVKWLREDAAAGSLGAEAERWLEQIPERVARMDRLLEDLLVYSRAVRAASGLEETDLRELVDEIAAVLEVPPGFSVAWVGEPCRISTRRAPLEQVLRNLVDNAFKHHDRALGCVEVAGRLLDDEWIEVEVRDDGPGIALELRERCFGLFRSMSKHRGTGIGLALVKRVVESHGGRVSIEDNAPRGAILRFVWPVGR